MRKRRGVSPTRSPGRTGLFAGMVASTKWFSVPKSRRISAKLAAPTRRTDLTAPCNGAVAASLKVKS